MDLEVKPKSDTLRQATDSSSLLGRYARMIGDEARRWRQGFTRENIAAFAWTMAWTAPLTVMIWVYAENAALVTPSNVPITIEVKSSDPRQVVLVDSRETTIECQLKGPQASIDRFEHLSPSKPVLIELQTKNLPTGQETAIPTLQNIQDNPIFKEAGITVQGCTPDFLTLTVENIKSKPCQVREPTNIPTLSKAVFKPDTVEVTGPENVVMKMDFVTADLSSLPLLSSPAGHAQLPPQTVGILPDPAVQLTYNPPRVEATLTLKEPDVAGHVPNVAIFVCASPDILQRYQITPAERTLPGIDLTGPQDQINELPHAGVYAWLAVTSEGDVIRSMTTPQTATLQFANLPAGVHIVGDNPKMSFTATAR